MNVAFHAVGAVLLWRVLRRLRIPGAELGAALWALHPVQVESVAWISELKNTQACVFYLLAIRFFLAWLAGETAAEKKERSYVLALGCAVLAILSKPSTVMLPVVLALAGWWLAGRWHWRCIARLAPFGLISAVAAGWTIWEQKYHSLALGLEWSQSWAERLALSGKVVWFYLGKLLWPQPLSFIYPRWEIATTGVAAWLPVLAVVLLLVALWRGRAGWGRAWFFVFAYFVVSLFPVLGFFNVYFFRYSYVADHFQHLASIGPMMLAGAGQAVVGERLALREWAAGARLAVGGLLLVGLGAQTWRQSRTYADTTTLWRATLAANPQCWLAYNWLGVERLDRGRIPEAKEYFERADRIKPGDHAVLTNLGNAYLKSDRVAEAIPYFERALRVQPDLAAAHNGLANALAAGQRLAEAIAEYREAVRLDPSLWQSHYNLARALFQNGRSADALPHFEAAVRLKPDGPDPRDAEYRANLANALFLNGRTAEAIGHYEAALRFKPDDAAAHHNLGMALLRANRAAEALARFETAVRLKPDLEEAQLHLGNALVQAGRVGEAMAHFTEATRLKLEGVEAHFALARVFLQAGEYAKAIPEFEAVLRFKPEQIDARADLAGALYVIGRPAEALGHYETARRAKPDDPLHSNLAGVLAQLGRIPEAIEHYEEALRLKPDYANAHCNFAHVLAASAGTRMRFITMRRRCAFTQTTSKRVGALTACRSGRRTSSSTE